MTRKTIFASAQLRFKLASGAGKYPAEGVAIQIRLNDDTLIMFEESNQHGNPVSQISTEIRAKSLSEKFTIEAVAFATELNTDTDQTFDPEPNSLIALRSLIAEQDCPPIFIVEGHSQEDRDIREYHLTP